MSALLAALPWSQILAAVSSLVVLLIGLAANKIKAAQASSDAHNKANTALLQLGVIATTLAGKAWDKLGPEIQKILADGKVTAEERAELEAVVKSLIGDVTSSDTLAQIASALGLPLPGLIAKIASMVLDIFVNAHTSSALTVGAKVTAYPVTESFEKPASGEDMSSVG